MSLRVRILIFLAVLAALVVFTPAESAWPAGVAIAAYLVLVFPKIRA